MPQPPETAADLVQARLRELVANVRTLEPGARDDAPDGVHAMRVAARRVRSLLATYRPVLDRTRTEPLRDELGWLTGRLGDVRDPEVLLERLATTAGTSTPSLDEALTTERRHAHLALVEALDSDRYRLLVGALDGAVADPPLTEAADRPAREFARKRLRHDWRRLDRVVAALPDDTTGRALDPHLHEVRKAAKRVRYAAETAESAEPTGSAGADEVTRLRKAATAFQERLGQHQDARLAEAYVGRLAAQTPAGPEDAGTHLALMGRAAADADEVAGDFPQIWRELSAQSPWGTGQSPTASRPRWTISGSGLSTSASSLPS